MKQDAPVRQKITAVVKTTVPVDVNEVRKVLEKLCVTIESVKVVG